MIHPNTICAISTASGTGAIAVIRISGSEAFIICNKIFEAANGKLLTEQPHATVRFGNIMDSNGEIADEVLVSIFHAPHSFTGENSVEISCHASPFIQQKILQLLLDNGCTLAVAGEFTQRAFLNGKMDLSQAEAIADVIASSSAAAHKMAINQMRGGFSTELMNLRLQLLDFVSLVELELDFSEEDVEFANRTQLQDLAEKIQQTISRLVNSFSTGNAIKQGIPVAIVGETNVGKSTLLNTLLNEERAIVSDIHGTTRDVIEDCITLGGVQFRFIDTAGIRQTSDTVENLGIERTYLKMQQANIVLLLVDASREITEIESFILEQRSNIVDKKAIVVFNKTDVIPLGKLEALNKIDFPVELEKIFISAKNKKGIAELEKLLLQTTTLPIIGENDVIVSNLRHYEALQKAFASINRVADGLQQRISGDFLSQDIRECMHYLGEITGGEITSNEVLGNIFERFCIGK